MTTTLFISLGLAACGSQSVLSQADANTQTTTQDIYISTTQTASYFEASDLTATYDESKAPKISLQGTTATVSGMGNGQWKYGRNYEKSWNVYRRRNGDKRSIEGCSRRGR